jgi:hypothetical protein
VGKFDFSQVITDLIHLLTIDGEDISLSGPPTNNNVIAYDDDSGIQAWVYKKIPLWEVLGVATMEDGLDLDMNGGDITLDSGSTVDGVDIDTEVLTRSGGPDYSPVANVMFYWDGEWKIGKQDLISGGDTELHYHQKNKTWCTGSGYQATDDDWVDIVWEEEQGNGFSVDSSGEITITNEGRYMIDVVLTSDYNLGNRIQYCRLVKQD